MAVLADAHALLTLTPAGLERLAGLAVPDLDDLAALLSVAGVTLLPKGWRSDVPTAHHGHR